MNKAAGGSAASANFSMHLSRRLTWDFPPAILCLLALTLLAPADPLQRISKQPAFSKPPKPDDNAVLTNIHRYQIFEPSSLRSDQLNLATNQTLTIPKVYNLYYRGRHHLIFQTCLEGEGWIGVILRRCRAGRRINSP